MKHKMVKLSQLKDTLHEEGEELDLDNGGYIKYNIFGPFLKGYKQEYGNWEELEKSLIKGYNPHQHSRGFITVVKIWFTDEYLVYDGSHRVRTLTKMYGKEYQIEVKVIPKWNAIGQLFLLLLMLPFIIIKRKINDKKLLNRH
jgi:hypothetical protein